MADEFDPFRGDTGLFEGLGRIDGVFFGKQGNAANLSANVTITDEQGNPHEQFYGLGSEWQSFDGGESVEHPRGENKSFSNQSPYFDFITHAMDAGAADEMRRRNRDLFSNHGPMHGKFWQGLVFDFEVVERPGRRPNEEGVWVNSTFNRVLPTKYHGVQGDSSATSPSADSVPSSQSASGSQGSTVNDGLGLSETDRAKLKTLALSHSYPEFVDAVTDLTDSRGESMVANAPLMQALADEGFYNSLR
jgi:hypothetical protein